MALKKSLSVHIVAPNTFHASLARLAHLQGGHFLLKYLLLWPACEAHVLERLAEQSIIPENINFWKISWNNEQGFDPLWPRICSDSNFAWYNNKQSGKLHLQIRNSQWMEFFQILQKL